MTGPGLPHTLEDYLTYLTHSVPTPIIGTKVEISLPGETTLAEKRLEISNMPANQFPKIHDEFIKEVFLSQRPPCSLENFLLLFSWVLRGEDQVIIVSREKNINLCLSESLRNLIYPLSLERGGYRVNVRD